MAVPSHSGKRRRRMQFSVRFLLVVVSIVCIWLGVQVQRASNQRQAVTALTRAGAEITYDYERNRNPLVSPEPWAPAWLRRWLGEDLFRSVVEVDLENAADTDECLKSLSLLPTVEVLSIDTRPIDSSDGYYQGWAKPEMTLNGRPATDRGLEHLRHLPRLRRLTLSGAHISQRGLRPIAGLRSLQSLYLYRSTIEANGLEHLSGLSDLEHLDLRSTAIGDTELRYLKGLPKLELLALDRTSITDAGLECLSETKNLTTLSVAENDISDVGLAHVSGLTQLQSLVVGDTRITDAGLKHLHRLIDLRSLYLCCTRITDAGLTSLLALPKLQSLDLRGTQVTDRGLEELATMPNLRLISIDCSPYSPADMESMLQGIRFGKVVQPRVTVEGVKALELALPQCEIESR